MAAGKPTESPKSSEDWVDERAKLTRAVSTEVAKFSEISAAWVFGSVARGDARHDSDLDLAVLLRTPSQTRNLPPRQKLRALAAALEPYSPSGRVDVLVLGEQGPVIAHRVLREGLLVCDADPQLRVDFEGRTIAAYLDWKPTHDIAMQATLGGLAARFARGGK